MTIGDPEINLSWRQARVQDDVLPVPRTGIIYRLIRGSALHVIYSEIIVETHCNGSLHLIRRVNDPSALLPKITKGKVFQSHYTVLHKKTSVIDKQISPEVQLE